MERVKHIVQFNILLGAWLIAAPFVLGYAASTREMGNDLALGVLLIAAAGQVGAGSLALLGGLWLIAAPYVWHYGHLSRPFSNDIFVGILSVLVSTTATWMIAARTRNPA
jgi:hypothetical protein